jgi:hypothetical protein
MLKIANIAKMVAERSLERVLKVSYQVGLASDLSSQYE